MTNLVCAISSYNFMKALCFAIMKRITRPVHAPMPPMSGISNDKLSTSMSISRSSNAFISEVNSCDSNSKKTFRKHFHNSHKENTPSSISENDGSESQYYYRLKLYKSTKSLLYLLQYVIYQIIFLMLPFLHRWRQSAMVNVLASSLVICFPYLSLKAPCIFTIAGMWRRYLKWQSYKHRDTRNIYAINVLYERWR